MVAGMGSTEEVGKWNVMTAFLAGVEIRVLAPAQPGMSRIGHYGRGIARILSGSLHPWGSRR